MRRATCCLYQVCARRNVLSWAAGIGSCFWLCWRHKDCRNHRIVRAGLTLGPLWVACQTDRSVLGSLRVAAQDLKIGALDRTTNVMELEPIAISRWLNERPCRVYNRLVWPGQAMREIVEAL